MTEFSLLYISKTSLNLNDGSIISQLSDILEKAIENNRKTNITGALIFDGSWFVQLLEGDRADVWSTFHKIEHDSRHSSVTPVAMTAIDKRIFTNWWMACAQRDADSEDLFVPHLINGQFQPDQMSAADLISMMVSLTNRGYERKLAKGAKYSVH